MMRPSIFVLAAALSILPLIRASGQDPSEPPRGTVYEVGKEGDAPEPPKVVPLTDLEILGDWKAEKIGDNESPVDDLYIHYNEKGETIAEGRYKDWKGGLVHSDGEINFYRKPLAEEMSDKAPPWAREKVAAEGKLEWKLALKAESRKGEWILEGKWHPGQFKWNETGEGAGATREASYVDEGKPVDVKFTKQPRIIRTIVLNRQMGRFYGRPWHPYPFIHRPPAGFGKKDAYSLTAPPPRDGVGQEGDTRTLFVLGLNLPTNYDKKIELRGADNTVEYRTIALGAENNLAADHKRLLKVGWDAAIKGLDSDTEKTVRKCAAMLVRADLVRGVSAGVKSYTLNNSTDSWRLRFGDDGGLITFGRDITSNESEDIDCAYLSENIYIEIRTATVFPTQEIPLRVMLNDKPVTWNGSDTIVAKYLKDIPTGQAYEVPRAAAPSEVVPRAIRVYRTPTINISRAGKAVGAGYRLVASAEDVLLARLDDPFTFTLTPAVAKAVVWDSPERDAESNLIMTWEEALAKAAILDGQGEAVKAGKNVAGMTGGSITNVVVTNFAIGKTRPAGEAFKQTLNDAFHSWTTLTPLWAPAMAWRFFFGDKGILTERVDVTIADHAALLLFKEAFIRKMSIGLAGLEKSTKATDPKERDAMLVGYRETLKASASGSFSPWDTIRVPGPDGGDVKLSWALDDGLRKSVCKGHTDGFAEEWSLRAVENGLEQYKAAIKHAIEKAKETPDNEIKKLIELIGYGYETLAPEIMQHMMRPVGSGEGTVWEPNHGARHCVWNLHTASDAVRAQEELSKLDTQVVLAAASVVAAPATLSESFALAVIGYAFDVATFSGQLFTETLPEFKEQIQRNDIRFALGASLVLGPERLNEAELKKTEWFQTTLNILPAAMGVAFGGEALSQMPRATANTKAALTLEVVERHGLQGAKGLTSTEKNALLIAASEAEMLKGMGAAKAMEKSHERVAAAVEKLADEAGAARAARAEADTNVVKATGEPVAVEKPKPPDVAYVPEPQKAAKSFVLEEYFDDALKGGSEAAEGGATSIKKNTGTVIGDDAKAPAKARSRAAERIDELEALNARRAQQTADPNQSPIDFQLLVENKAVTFGLGTFFGEGTTATVWDVVAGAFKGRVAKFIHRGDGFRSAGGIAADQIAISKRLSDKQILHLKVSEAPGCTSARTVDGQTAMPFVLQERLPPGAKLLPEETPLDDIRAFLGQDAAAQGLDSPGEAYAKLQWQIKNANLAAEDLGWRNVFWVHEGNGNWLCGILDVDRIVPFAERSSRMGAFFDWFEAQVSRGTVRSLFRSERTQFKSPKPDLVSDFDFSGEAYLRRTPQGQQGPYFPSAEFFAEKAFEHKAWLQCEMLDASGNVTQSAHQAVSAHLKDGMIKLKHVKKYFPEIDDPAKFKKLDLTKPFDPKTGGKPIGLLPGIPAGLGYSRELAEGDGTPSREESAARAAFAGEFPLAA